MADPALEKGPSQSGARTIDGCSCSCDDLPYLEKLQRAVDSGKKLSQSAMKELRERMRCMTRCSAFYRTCQKK